MVADAGKHGGRVECIRLIFDDGSGKAFDKAVHGGLTEGGDLTLITKNKATHDGNPCLVVTFTVRLPDGSIARAQSVTTLRAFLLAARAILARYAIT